MNFKDWEKVIHSAFSPATQVTMLQVGDSWCVERAERYPAGFIARVSDPIEVTPVQLISGSRSIQGWAAGTAADSEDTLHFAALSGVRPMIETYPLEKAGEAFARMMSGKAQFRVVLTM